MNVAGSAIFDQIWAGTIGVEAMAAAKGTSGLMKVNVTLAPVTFTELITDQMPGPSSAGYFFSRLKENSTSAEVNGRPSLHFTPERSVYTSVVGLVNL